MLLGKEVFKPCALQHCDFFRACKLCCKERGANNAVEISAYGKRQNSDSERFIFGGNVVRTSSRKQDQE